MTGPIPLPPEDVANFDRLITQAGVPLDQMIKRYRGMAKLRGTAGGAALIADDIRKAPVGNILQFLDMLIVAISRLGDEDHE